MNIKKPLLVAGVATGVTLASLTGAGIVSAATTTGTDGQSTLVSKIAKKFSLKESEVKAVFDEERTARQAERQAEVEKGLAQLVTDGKITEEQKAKLIAKAKELQAAHEAEHTAMEGKTREERKAAMDAKKAELEKWFADNGISTDYIKYVAGHGGRGHGGHDGGMRGDKHASDSTTTN